MSQLTRVFSSAWGRVAVILSVAIAMVAGALPANAVVSIARSNYVVRVVAGSDAAVRANLTSMGDIPTDEIDYVFDGFVVKLSDSEAAALRADKNVLEVLPDAPISLLDTDSNPPSWGLDRIDQNTLPLDNSFTYPSQGGAGVRVYIVDTGVQADNPDFTGRILPGYDVIGTQQQNTDCNGHGTHVAGTVAGTRYGIAKKASIVPVRVLNCSGSGSFSGIISALDWIKANNPVGTPAVINMSIGGSYYKPVNDAVESLVAAGITASIAAGNSNADACTFSPASAPSAITVGATESTDARAYYSNYGDCVDMFAPGSNIVSDDAFAPGNSKALSGTSMATPHITGATALILGQHPTWKPADVVKALQDNASLNQVTNALSTNSGLLNIKFLNAANTTPTPIAGVPDAPTAVKVTSIAQTTATVSWTAPANDGGSPITGYKVSYRESAVAAWQTMPASTTSANLTGLTSLASYQVQVVATNAVGDSVPTANISFTTLGSLADAPTALTVTMDHGNYVRLGWTAPANGGNTITSYTVQQLKNAVWTTVASGSNLTSTVVSNLVPLTAYSFRVFANNASGAGPATSLDYTTGPLAPVAPALTLSAITGKGATVSWAPSASTDPNYTVSYEVTYGYQTSLTPLKTVVQTTTGYVISTLYPLIPSWVKVQALEGKSSSGGSLYYFTTTADVPTTPYFNSTVKTSTGFNLSWSVSSTGGSPILDYLVQSSPTNTSTSVWTDVATVTTTTLAVPTPDAGVGVYYRVSARNAVGSSPFATPTSVWGVVVAPTAPQNLAVTAGNPGVLVTWDAPANNGGVAIVSYQIRYTTNNGSTWILGPTIAAGGRTTISYNWAISMGKGQVAQFQVAASNGQFASPWSNSVSYSIAKTAPAAPTALKVTADTTGRFNVSWTAPTDNGGAVISNYLIQSLGTDGNWTTVAQSTATTYLGNLGVSGQTLTLRVLAVNEVGTGAASNVVVVLVPFQQAEAPQNFAGVLNVPASRVDLSWTAPSNTYGGTVSSYVIQISTNNGTSWISYVQIAGNATSAAAPMPAKGVTYQYRVYAITQAGVGKVSSVVSITRDVTAPANPTLRSLTLTNGSIPNLAWNPPTDNGGSAVTGYVVEQNTSNGWTEVARVAGTVTSFVGAAQAPGVTLQYRVSAINATGTSAPSAVASVTTPLLKPAAPSGVTVTEITGSTSLSVNWTAASDLGGAPSATRYQVEVSSTGGQSWNTYNAAPTAVSYSIARPAKGVTFTIRVITITGYGRSDSSNVVTYSTPATAPSAPYGARVTFGTDGNPIFAWYAPTDGGGSPITSYQVELGTAGIGANSSAVTISWAAPVSVPGNVLQLIGLRGAPGTYQFVRVTAVNAIGNSPVSNIGAVMVPLVKPAPVTNLTGAQLTTGSTNVTLNWVASANLGGSTTASYQVERTVDGQTWTSYTTTSATTLLVAGPAKGLAFGYRVATRTGYGLSDYSNVVIIATPMTVPANPASISGALSTDGSKQILLNWAAPYDNGGSPITGYRIDRSENNSASFTTVATTPANVVSASIPFSAPGTSVVFRVYAINALGTSTAAIVYSVRIPYDAPAPVAAPTVTLTNSSTGTTARVQINWTAGTSFGGSTLGYYSLQQSTDGVNWTNLANTTALSYSLNKPATGTRVSYRVVVVSSAGIASAVSASTTVTY